MTQVEMIRDRFGCLGSTIITASGSYFDLSAPKPEMVDIRSIASALSKICRFGGHCHRFYSVAEHCVHCSELSESHEHHVLLHDSAEAYIGDVVKPLKQLLSDYQAIEWRIEAAVWKHFGIVPTDESDAEVKRCDRAMLKAEKIHFWPRDKENWTGFSDIPHERIKIREWSPVEAERNFMEVAEVLGLA